MNPSSPLISDVLRGTLRLMENTCGLAIDLDDSKQMIHRQFQFLRAGKINSERPTTERAIIELFSKRAPCSVERARGWLRPDRLEELRHLSPCWSLDLDIFCDQRNSSEFFNYRPDDTKIRVSFVDGTENSLDVGNLPSETSRRLAERAITDVAPAKPTTGKGQGGEDHLSRIADKLLLECDPALPKHTRAQIVRHLDDKTLLAILERRDAVKRELCAVMRVASQDGTPLSPRGIVNAIFDALDRLTRNPDDDV